MTNQKLKLPQMETINETAKLFNVSPYFVRQTVLTGKVPHVKAGKKYLISVEKFSEYLNAGEQQGQQQETKHGEIRKVV